VLLSLVKLDGLKAEAFQELFEKKNVNDIPLNPDGFIGIIIYDSPHIIGYSSVIPYIQQITRLSFIAHV